MLHVSTSAAHVIMHSDSTFRTMHRRYRDTRLGGGVTTLQTSVQNGSRSRHIIPVNYKNKLRASYAKKTYKNTQFFNSILKSRACCRKPRGYRCFSEKCVDVDRSEWVLTEGNLISCGRWNVPSEIAVWLNGQKHFVINVYRTLIQKERESFFSGLGVRSAKQTPQPQKDNSVSHVYSVIPPIPSVGNS
jgi:hypothetical protein